MLVIPQDQKHIKYLKFAKIQIITVSLSVGLVNKQISTNNYSPYSISILYRFRTIKCCLGLWTEYGGHWENITKKFRFPGHSENISRKSKFPCNISRLLCCGNSWNTSKWHICKVQCFMLSPWVWPQQSNTVLYSDFKRNLTL